MARTYTAVHKRSGEWSRKTRKATDTRRVRRAVRIVLRHIDQVVDPESLIHLAFSPAGAEML